MTGVDWDPSISYSAGDIFSWQNKYYKILSVNESDEITSACKRIALNDVLHRIEYHLYNDMYTVPKYCCDSGPAKTNCKNCGASLRGHYRCEYCGTVNN